MLRFFVKLLLDSTQFHMHSFIKRHLRVYLTCKYESIPNPFSCHIVLQIYSRREYTQRPFESHLLYEKTQIERRFYLVLSVLHSSIIRKP